MKRERPPMPPLAVRVQVAERQYFGEFIGTPREGTKKAWLAFLIDKIGKGQPCHLDHDPALILRPYNPRVKDVAARYTPHAHDPDALIYREKADHQQKTTGRKPGASKTATTLGSDIWVKTKFNRLEGRVKKRPKVKIPNRPFSVARKFKARKAGK